MERDDIAFCESLREHGLTVSLIGTHPETTAYEFTARKIGEKTLKYSDLSLEDALNQEQGYELPLTHCNGLLMALCLVSMCWLSPAALEQVQWIMSKV